MLIKSTQECFRRNQFRDFDRPTLNFTESVEVIQTIRLEMALPSCPLMQSKEKKIVQNLNLKMRSFCEESILLH